MQHFNTCTLSSHATTIGLAGSPGPHGIGPFVACQRLLAQRQQPHIILGAHGQPVGFTPSKLSGVIAIPSKHEPTLTTVAEALAQRLPVSLLVAGWLPCTVRHFGALARRCQFVSLHAEPLMAWLGDPGAPLAFAASALSYLLGHHVECAVFDREHHGLHWMKNDAGRWQWQRLTVASAADQLRWQVQRSLCHLPVQETKTTGFVAGTMSPAAA